MMRTGARERCGSEIAMRKAVVLFSIVAASCAFAQDAPLPKFGPEAVPILEDATYLREAPAPDYWMLSAFYVPQTTTSDCSAAAIVMAVNALKGLPPNADQEIVTEDTLLASVGNEAWVAQVSEDGSGVTFEETETYIEASLAAFDLASATVEAVSPEAADAPALEALRAALVENEASPDNVMLIYFNQGVITGDWDGPHISPISAYDAERDRVLVMDVDRDWYVPYWTSTETLLAALVKPISEEHGVLAGGRGGYILVTQR
jgi:hypothetical protein